jgi:hypothetical protein
VDHRCDHHFYLTHSELLPDPCSNTPWQRLYTSQSNRAFITTKGFDVTTFNDVLDAGFHLWWDSSPIPRDNAAPKAITCPAAQSLSVEGGLGLALHYLNSTMREITLQQVFALVPTVLSCYITFALAIILKVL